MSAQQQNWGYPSSRDRRYDDPLSNDSYDYGSSTMYNNTGSIDPCQHLIGRNINNSAQYSNRFSSSVSIPSNGTNHDPYELIDSSGHYDQVRQFTSRARNNHDVQPARPITANQADFQNSTNCISNNQPSSFNYGYSNLQQCQGNMPIPRGNQNSDGVRFQPSNGTYFTDSDANVQDYSSHLLNRQGNVSSTFTMDDFLRYRSRPVSSASTASALSQDCPSSCSVADQTEMTSVSSSLRASDSLYSPSLCNQGYNNECTDLPITVPYAVPDENGLASFFEDHSSEEVPTAAAQHKLTGIEPTPVPDLPCVPNDNFDIFEMAQGNQVNVANLLANTIITEKETKLRKSSGSDRADEGLLAPSFDNEVEQNPRAGERTLNLYSDEESTSSNRDHNSEETQDEPKGSSKNAGALEQELAGLEQDFIKSIKKLEEDHEALKNRHNEGKATVDVLFQREILRFGGNRQEALIMNSELSNKYHLSNTDNMKKRAPQTKKRKYCSFDQRCKELVEYKKKHGNCNVPKRFAENPALGRWCGNIRMAYNKLQRGHETTRNLSKERIQRLLKIGFKWKAE